jgi:transposase
MGPKQRRPRAGVDPVWSRGHLDAGDDRSPERSPRAENPSPYPLEFRAEAVRLVRTSSKPIREVAEELGVSEQTLRNWLRRGDPDDGHRSRRLTTAEREELGQLRRGVPGLEQERESPQERSGVRCGSMLDR